MEGIKYTPIGKIRLTPRQEAEKYIRKLEYCVVALGILCIGMGVTICAMLM